MGEPYPCKARVTIYDTLSKRNIVENNFVHCNDIESGGSFKHSRYQITVHERVYAQKYLDEQNAIQQQKEAEARARADARELEQELRRIEDEKKKAEEKILADQQNIINQTVVTPISDIPVTTSSPIINDEIPQGYHKMPDGTIMKDSEHKTEREKLIEKSSIAILVIGGIGLYLALRFKK